LAQRETAAQKAAGSGPEEPGSEHDTKRNLIAAEDDHQFAHENDLADDGAEPYQHQSGTGGVLQAMRLASHNGMEVRFHPNKIRIQSPSEYKDGKIFS
jgi:hypothetical protein